MRRFGLWCCGCLNHHLDSNKAFPKARAIDGFRAAHLLGAGGPTQWPMRCQTQWPDPSDVPTDRAEDVMKKDKLRQTVRSLRN